MQYMNERNMKTKTKTNLSPTTIHRLNVVMRNVLKYPEQVKMETWFSGTNAVGNIPPRCGTAGCIGGWAIALFAKKKPMNLKEAKHLASIKWFETEWQQAARSLGLIVDMSNRTEDERDHCNRLFSVPNWPRNLAKAYNKAATAKGVARVVVNRIKHFIKTDGEE